MAVDLFFILSGFFFTLKFDKKETFSHFLKKKIIRLYPALIAIIIFTSLLPFCETQFYTFIITIFGLNGTPLCFDHIGHGVGQFWYVSTMLWTMSLLFYLMKKDFKNLDFILFIIMFLSYGMLVHLRGGNFDVIYKYHYFINGGMLRAISGVSAGYFIAKWYIKNIDKINGIKPTAAEFLICSILEFGTLYFIVNNLMLHAIKYKNQIIFIIVFILAIILLLLKKGVISRLLDNKILLIFSKYTYSIYAVHYLMVTIFFEFYKNNTLLVENHLLLYFMVYIVYVFVFSFILYHFIEKPCFIYLKKKFNL